jgi:hypothetical protein
MFWCSLPSLGPGPAEVLGGRFSEEHEHHDDLLHPPPNTPPNNACITAALGVIAAQY